MTSEAQTQTLNYFHLYAVRDRVDVSQKPDNPSLPDVACINIDEILPSSNDVQVMKDNFAVLICHVIKKYLPFFKTFGKRKMLRIKNPREREMSQKSEVVSSSIGF